MTIREQISCTINNLTDTQLGQVAEYLSFLKFRSRKNISIDEKKLAELYDEFSEEDLVLAEEGIEDYNKHLGEEDQK